MGIEDKNASNQILDTYIRNTGFFSRIWCVRRVTPMNMVYVGSFNLVLGVVGHVCFVHGAFNLVLNVVGLVLGCCFGHQTFLLGQ